MFYRCLKAVVKPLFFLLFRVKLIGKENGRFDGKMIVYSNHCSNLDPIFMHLAVKPKVHFMAKKELFKNPLLRWLIVSLGAFPIDRGAGDTEAIKSAFKILKRGDTLGIFPEGTRSKTGKLGKFQSGAALIAIRTKSPLLPVYIRGKFRIFHRNYIVIGEPVDMTLDAGIEPANIRAAKEGAEYLKQRIEELEALSNAIVGEEA